MHSLNPFLRAFFKSTLPGLCIPVNNHVLLAPTTECLLAGRDRDSDSSYVDLALSEDFLASHVIRVQGPEISPANGNVRENRGKAKQFNTVNGRTVVVKDSSVYSNKGFRNLNQSQLLNDTLFFPDSLDQQPWLVYYISKPLVGSYEPTKAITEVLTSAANLAKPHNTANGSSSARLLPGSSSSIDTKNVKSFNDLLNQFPLIARQMHLGLDKVFQEFHHGMGHQRSPIRSRRLSNTSQEPQRSASVGSAHSKSNGSIHSSLSYGHPKSPSLSTLRVDEEENNLRGHLETAITSAIDLFQQVDKQQLSVLGATTDLTGPAVERLIERYVTEQLHDSVLFSFLRSSRRLEDLELESRINNMQHIDIAQVGIEIEGGRAEKLQMMERINKGVEEFRKLGVAGSPQQMIDILLATQKLLSREQKTNDNLRKQLADAQSSEPAEKMATPLTINADTLVSLLLVVVIRSQVRNLNAMLSYMRNFIFIDDVEGGEIGYALSTFEAVISYLSSDSAGLRKASRRNKKLWNAIKRGEVRDIKAIMEPSKMQLDGVKESPRNLNDVAIEDIEVFEESDGHANAVSDGDQVAAWSLRPSTEDGYASEGSTLAHVFPFQAAVLPRKGKRVSLDVRSLSNASEHSFISRTTTLDSKFSGIEGDTSIGTLAQTQDIEGDSILMMAVEARQPGALAYLLSLKIYFSTEFVLEDCNQSGTTLLSAAVQLVNDDLIEQILSIVFDAEEKEVILKYFAQPDTRGRTVAHYLFNAPHLIARYWDWFPWRMKDKNGQTPLFALCRSYDHSHYADMINEALEFATKEQGDEQPLDLDYHVDAKGNTLLHVINDPSTAARMLQQCDSDPNATNDRLFTPLMVASKYGRMDMVRALFGDERVDVVAKEARGMTAVELAKDDEIRNRIDDMVLVSNVPATNGRVTAVVRSFFVDDASVRMMIKSAVRNDNGMIGVTTCRRSVTDFENLAKWLAVEHPASWLPSIFNFRSPFQIPSRPSRAVLQDTQARLDRFLKIMLAHSTFSTHELLWEFILFPEIQPDMMAERSRKKAEIRIENVREDYEPVTDVRDVSSFVEHARESIRLISHSTKSVVRRVTSFRVGLMYLSTATELCAKDLATLQFLPVHHVDGFRRYAVCVQPYASDPHQTFHQDFQAISATILAILSSLARPHALIDSLVNIQKNIDRHDSSSRRTDRWPLGLLDETRKGIHADAKAKAIKSRQELRTVGCELRYTQQNVAGELAGWQELHAKLGRRAIRALAEKMVVREKDRLAGMKRALKGVVGTKKGNR